MVAIAASKASWETEAMAAPKGNWETRAMATSKEASATEATQVLGGKRSKLLREVVCDVLRRCYSW